tara:strand:- start:342 stop:773 length:432 start_codon:yes stop_codon:yes gene_type:complete
MESKMRIVIMILLIASAGFSGHWLYEKHIRDRDVVVRQVQLQNTNKGIRTTHTTKEGYESFKKILEEDTPSAIVIIIGQKVKDSDICKNGSKRHRIIISNNKNPELKLLERWSIRTENLSTPYTIILNKGNVIIHTFGVICDY